MDRWGRSMVSAIATTHWADSLAESNGGRSLHDPVYLGSPVSIKELESVVALRPIPPLLGPGFENDTMATQPLGGQVTEVEVAIGCMDPVPVHDRRRTEVDTGLRPSEHQRLSGGDHGPMVSRQSGIA